MTYDQLCDLGTATNREAMLVRAEAQIGEQRAVAEPRRFILWQLAHSPASIAGTITAPHLAAAAAIGRARFGSFHVVEWSQATDDERVAAVRADERESIANGDVCWECGEAFLDRQGQPTMCRDCGGTAPTRLPFVPVVPLPAALLPEFSDSRDEPNGPARLDVPDVRQVVVRGYAKYLIGLAILNRAWEAHRFDAFTIASWCVLGFHAPVGDTSPWFHTTDGRYFANDVDRRAHQRTLDEKAGRYARRVAAFGVRFAITEQGKAALAAEQLVEAGAEVVGD